jgi:hypothetical protein
MKGVRIFQREKEKSSPFSLGYFRLKGEENWTMEFNNNIIEKSCQIEDN